MIVIKIDILLGTIHIQDSFEWDLSNPDNSPEEFAAIFVSDLTLSSKFKDFPPREIQVLEQTVALEIRRQIDMNCLEQASKTRTAMHSLMQT